LRLDYYFGNILSLTSIMSAITVEWAGILSSGTIRPKPL